MAGGPRDESHEDDLVAVLLKQHGEIRRLCAVITDAHPASRAQWFKRFQALLTAHEASEHAIVRQMTLETAGESTIGDREAEERSVRTALLDVSRLPVTSAEFEVRFSHLASLLRAHLDAEEREEFPHLLAHFDAEERLVLGRRFVAAGKLAPSAPSGVLAKPAGARIVLRPLAALVQRTKDVQRSERSIHDRRPAGGPP
jgi:hypothetical protein